MIFVYIIYNGSYNVTDGGGGVGYFPHVHQMRKINFKQPLFSAGRLFAINIYLYTLKIM